MTLEAFRATLTRAHPPTVTPALQALWHAARGDWDEAHRIAQEVNDSSGAWIHAHLHRQEGDLANARYWYRQAGQREASDALEAEWTRIVTALLDTE